jgi:hypothetical protein
MNGCRSNLRVQTDMHMSTDGVQKNANQHARKHFKIIINKAVHLIKVLHCLLLAVTGELCTGLNVSNIGVLSFHADHTIIAAYQHAL